MENREMILQDYFELQNILNRANRMKNEVNSLVFVSELGKDSIVRVFAKTNNARLLICRIRTMDKWLVDGAENVPYLKKYIIGVLNKNLKISNSLNHCDDLIKHSIHELLNYHSTDF
jgi:hypothetical protein